MVDNCDALRDLVPFVQFKKREKHPWRNVNLSTKSNAPPWMFFTFFKLYKWYQIVQRIAIVKSKTWHSPIFQEHYFFSQMAKNKG